MRQKKTVRLEVGLEKSTITSLANDELFFKTRYMYNNLGRPIVRQALMMRIWGVPPAGGLLLQLPTAQADRGNYPNSYRRNLANDRTPRAVDS